MHGEVLVTSPWGVSSREGAQFILDAHAGGCQVGTVALHSSSGVACLVQAILLRQEAWRLVDAIETCR